MADPYHKIVTVWNRDPKTHFKTLLDHHWATPEFEYLKDVEWDWTEKIDGTNIRILWDGENVTYKGKTDTAQIPSFLLDRLKILFAPDYMKAVFNSDSYCLYGEGYGAKIQKGGGKYIADGVSFILFDVLCGGLFLRRFDVEDIARRLSISVVPIVGVGSLDEAIQFIKKKPYSLIGDCSAEGLVMKPCVELCDRRGHRIITKIKVKDFNRGEKDG